ncbi:MAG: hypothetical protein HY271_02715 [Deltaproteobacteria bacterium]|nr:hypothetical protein [Deltaproteobacteria bacterium]
MGGATIAGAAASLSPSDDAGYDRVLGGGDMRILTVAAVPVLLLASVCTAAALDCTRIKALAAEGTRPSDIARQLGITTPDVQACLAGEVDESPPPRSQQPVGSMAPTLPSSDSAIPRPPGQ